MLVLTVFGLGVMLLSYYLASYVIFLDMQDKALQHPRDYTGSTSVCLTLQCQEDTLALEAASKNLALILPLAIGFLVSAGAIALFRFKNSLDWLKIKAG